MNTIKEGYEEVDFDCGISINTAVKLLMEHPRKAYGVFNGHVLYSDTSDLLNSAYIEITGKSKEENDEERKKEREEYEARESSYRERIPELSKYWIEAGHIILKEDKWELWDKCVPIRLGDLYHGIELDCCLKIIQSIEVEGFEKARELFESQGHSGMSHSLVCSMLRSFCSQGKEFVDYVNKL